MGDHYLLTAFAKPGFVSLHKINSKNDEKFKIKFR
jgi:hypothetical protein